MVCSWIGILLFAAGCGIVGLCIGYTIGLEESFKEIITTQKPPLVVHVICKKAQGGSGHKGVGKCG